MKIGLIVAMDSEYDQMVRVLGDEKGVVNGNEVYVRKCGIGKVNAAIGAVDFIREEHLDCLLSSGVAGGIDQDLDVMDVVVGEYTVYHDVWCGEGNEYGQVQGMPAKYKSSSSLYAVAMKEDGIPKKGGLICTGDQFITNKESLRDIKNRFPDGLAVDMESAAIAQACHKKNVPFVSMRVISDTPGTAKDHWKQYENFWKSVSDCSFKAVRLFLERMPNVL